MIYGFPWLASVIKFRLEKFTNDKRSSLLWKTVIYGQKKFYNIGPWCRCYETFYGRKLQMFVVS
jgi:hypothetical protein